VLVCSVYNGKEMIRLLSYFQTPVGNKIIVALSGLGLVGFVVFHMLGNLQIFEGSFALNRYAALLHDMPILFWMARLGLLSVVILHVSLAIQLSVRNRRARPVGYAVRKYRQASISSRTMAGSGIVLLLFIVFHLLHLTAGVIDSSLTDRVDLEGHRDVFGKIIHAFQNPFMVMLYIIGQLGLGLHVSHAVSSSLQTLGLEYGAFNRLFKVAGPAVALMVVLGNTAIIVAVFLGVVRA
jgi:succinate dehydrogenase / fumarate reductase, cytochrome b subunit